jgi:hypothetical protein
MYHTVPVCIHAWLTFPDDCESAIRTVIECGGDADTTAAIVGGVVGASLGAAAIPKLVRERLEPGLYTDSKFGTLAQSPAGIDALPGRCQRIGLRPWRNIFVFLPIVLLHGLRRLLPPY